MEEQTLEKKLEGLRENGLYPFHMPGHKRRGTDDFTRLVYGSDITEITGFDDLHNAQGIIREEQERAAALFGAKKSFFLVNGSTSGIIAALLAVSTKPLGREYDRFGRAYDDFLMGAPGVGSTGPNTGNIASNDKSDTVLMAAGVHKAAYNGMILADLDRDIITIGNYKDCSFPGRVDVQGLIKKIEKRRDSEKGDYRAVYITSPTYEGIVSDIRSISEAAHKYGIPVIVDEAHGAHLGLIDRIADDEVKQAFPRSAVSEGADIVIESLHKTLPAMTQTSILHVNGDLVDVTRLKKALTMIQSSSPSYVLMRSITTCLHYMGADGQELFRSYKSRLDKFYENTSGLTNIKVLDDRTEGGRDPGKIVILTGRANSKEVFDILRKDYYLEPEAFGDGYVLLMTSVMDTDEGFLRLSEALKEIDGKRG